MVYRITAKRGKVKKPRLLDEDQTLTEYRAAMNWTSRLKRVFDIDIETCVECGGEVRMTAPSHLCARGISASMHVIACIEDPEVIQKILAHFSDFSGNIAFKLLIRLTYKLSKYNFVSTNMNIYIMHGINVFFAGNSHNWKLPVSNI